MNSIILADTPKKQQVRKPHIISNLHLSKFANDAGKLFVYEKDRPVRPSIPKNECVERDYFEYKINGQHTNNLYENWFARTETAVGAIYPNVCGQEPSTQVEREVWAIFIAQIFLRSRKVRHQLGGKLLREMEQTFDPAYAREIQYELFKTGRLIQLSDIKDAIRRQLIQMRSCPAFGHLFRIEQSTRNLAASLMFKRWCISEASSGDEFVTSDCPVSTARLVGNQIVALGQGFNDKATAIFFPLSPTKIFIASPAGTDWVQTFNADQVRNINVITARFAHKNVYARRESELLKKLVDSEINQIEFGVNAFVSQNAQVAKLN